jgi:hypothetical protein
MSRYSHLFTDPQGPGDKRPTALDIVSGEHLDGKFLQKVALVTGRVSSFNRPETRPEESELPPFVPIVCACFSGILNKICEHHLQHHLHFMFFYNCCP